MKSIKHLKRIGELFLFSIGIGAINLVFPTNPGFFQGAFNPYLYLALIVSAYYGKYYGFLSLLLSCFIILLPLPLALELFHPGTWQARYWMDLRAISLIPLAITLIAVYVLGIIRDANMSALKKAKERLKVFSREKGLMHKQKKVVETVNRELEQRIYGQQDSITALYAEIQELFSLNLQKALEAILETIQKFSGATRASIWELNPESKDLRLAASLGWESSGNLQTILSVDDSIEGWVLRNNMMFSVKMLVQYENLRKMDTGRNLMTFPIYAGRKIWGVLNIGEMPFARYNLYTEKLIMMILALGGPALEKAIEYESVIRQAEVHPLTGLPAFSQFYSLLQSTIQRVSLEKGTLSVLLLELVNFDLLADQFSREGIFSLLAQITDELKGLSKNKAGFFHYKSENQIAVLFPNLDFDGASLFSLETLSMISQKEWQINERSLSLEVILGYAALGERGINADEILKIAENILEMQKL